MKKRDSEAGRDKEKRRDREKHRDKSETGRQRQRNGKKKIQVDRKTMVMFFLCK